jgi:putative heme-binding domain-containing protein
MPMPFTNTHVIARAVCILMATAAPAGAQQLLNQDHPGQYSQEDIAAGNRVYNAQCNQCHGRDGDQISGVDLRRGVFRSASTDEDLARVITNGTAAGMPPFRLQLSELTGIVAFIRAHFDTTASVRVGDAARGHAIFEGKGMCSTCHRVNGRGPRVAPDLSDIGVARAPAALERSIREPSSALMPIHRPVTIVMKDRTVIRGRRLNEDTLTVQVIDDKERLLSIAKRDIEVLEVSAKASMPAFADRLTADEIADTVAYLLTLREP